MEDENGMGVGADRMNWLVNGFPLVGLGYGTGEVADEKPESWRNRVEDVGIGDRIETGTDGPASEGLALMTGGMGRLSDGDVAKLEPRRKAAVKLRCW